MKKINKNILNSLQIYIWMLPAFILVFFFLIKPAFQTFFISLTEKIKISENQISVSINKIILENGNRDIKNKNKFKQLKNWKPIIKKINKTFNIFVKYDEINDEMTVKDTTELILIKIYNRLENEENLTKFVWFKNYKRMLNDSLMIQAFKNNILWLILFTSITVSVGLITAKLFIKIKWANIAKTIIFIPMSISYVASGIIWSFMYDKDVNIGTINALLNTIFKLLSFTGLNKYQPVAFLGRAETVNYALIFTGIWIWTGFCTVIFTAALNNIPKEIIEASKIDGANSIQTFLKIELPVIFPTTAVVITTMIINVLKIFDIVYTMTGGGPAGVSEVTANRMYRTAFNEGNFEYAAAIAVVLFLAIIPAMIFNIKIFIKEEINKN